MDEEKLRAKLAKIRKGEKVAVIPLSVAYGDEITAIGVPCATPERDPIELFDPFEAFMEEFDGEILRLRTASYYCLKVSIADLKDIVIFAGAKPEEEFV